MTADPAPAARSAPPRVSVVIPHLNTPDLLDRCLASVAAQSLDRGDFEIIVVDNGSTVPLAAVRAAWPRVCWLVEPAPGPGLARNRGIAAAAAPVLAFIDADCRAAPGWLQAAVEAVEAVPGRAVAGGEIRIDFVDPARPTAIEAYEAVFSFRQRWYIATKAFSVTANLAMAAPVHAAVGPFGGIAIKEDYDWGRRAAAAGFATRYVAGMLVYHPARADFAALARKWQRHVAHDFEAHVAAGRPLWRWRALALVTFASLFVSARHMLFSDRLTGLRNRWRGLVVLTRVRTLRAAEMWRVARPGAQPGNLAWNR